MSIDSYRRVHMGEKNSPRNSRKLNFRTLLKRLIWHQKWISIRNTNLVIRKMKNCVGGLYINVIANEGSNAFLITFLLLCFFFTSGRICSSYHKTALKTYMLIDNYVSNYFIQPKNRAQCFFLYYFFVWISTSSKAYPKKIVKSK